MSIAAIITPVLLLAAGQSNVPSVSTSGQVSGLPTAHFPAQTQTMNVVNWDSNSLPRIFQRSDQLPLTDEDIEKLATAGFDRGELVKMIEQRRCACDASADGLIRLKKRGVPDEVISAISLHGLKPNRSLTLEERGSGELSLPVHRRWSVHSSADCEHQRCPQPAECSRNDD